jgi:hypothetical protein
MRKAGELVFTVRGDATIQGSLTSLTVDSA